MDKKLCKYCGEEKDKSEFYSHPKSKDRLQYHCKSCWGNLTKDYRGRNKEKVASLGRKCYLNKKEDRIRMVNEWKKNNPEKVAKIKKDFKERNPEYSRFLTLKKRGITFEQFDEMLLKNNNSCWICNSVFLKRENAHIDHCHETNIVRGLLCSFCNTSLGLVKDDVNILKSMINYLLENGKKF